MARKNNALSADVAVIGAGVIGLACAFRLARAGKRVILVDRNEPGCGCSYGNAGHIATELIHPLASISTLMNATRYMFSAGGPLSIRPSYAMRIAPWLARFVYASRPTAFHKGTSALSSLQRKAMPAFSALLRDAEARRLLHKNGSLALVEKLTNIRAAKQELSELNAQGVNARWLEPGQTREFAPAVTPAIAGAIFFPDTGHVSNPYGVCKSLANAFISSGGALAKEEISTISHDATYGFRLTGSTQEVLASKVIVSAGAWSKPLAAQLGYNIPLDTERGYHLTAEGFHADITMPVASYERKVIMTPMEMGLRITGGVEFGGLQLPENEKRFDMLSNHLSALIPGAANKQASRWMGFRPSLPDHLPVICESSKHRGAFFAFGHQHLGLTLSGITSEIMLALCEGREAPISTHPFSADRFY